MKILAISDREEGALWDYYDPQRLADVELIISCGDLDPDYLEFLVTMQSCPLLYVRGNHDSRYDTKPPCGCIPIDDRIYDHQGIRILGLGGCMRYRPQASGMYTEREMAARIRRMQPVIGISGGIDILVTHAPAKGYGDQGDLPHRGFSCLNKLLEKEKPTLMLHGHVHQEYGNFVRERKHPCGTRIINTCGWTVIDWDQESAPARTGSFLFDFYLNWKERTQTGNDYEVDNILYRRNGGIL